MQHARGAREDHHDRKRERVAGAATPEGAADGPHSLIGGGEDPDDLHSKGRGDGADLAEPLQEWNEPQYGDENGKDDDPVPSQEGLSVIRNREAQSEIENEETQMLVPTAESIEFVP